MVFIIWRAYADVEAWCIGTSRRACRTAGRDALQSTPRPRVCDWGM